jgi:hypothetical protein
MLFWEHSHLHGYIGCGQSGQIAVEGTRCIHLACWDRMVQGKQGCDVSRNLWRFGDTSLCQAEKLRLYYLSKLTGTKRRGASNGTLCSCLSATKLCSAGSLKYLVDYANNSGLRNYRTVTGCPCRQ